MNNDFISRSALYKRMFPYDVVDKKDYAINAKAVEQAILEAPAVSRPTVTTLYGYNVEGLIFVAELLNKHGVSEDELNTMWVNFQKMYEIIIQDQKRIIEGCMMKITYPSMGEVWEKFNRGSNNE